MKVAVVTPFPNIIVPHLKYHGLVIGNKNPNVVVCFGGEGTFLKAEEKFPNVPKVLIRYHKGDKLKKKILYAMIKHLLDGKHKKIKEPKVEAVIKGKGKLVGLNEINIHYKPPQAVRLGVSINGKDLARGELTGDGLVVSTPYGSSAYFQSITGKTFAKGLGLAFNNLTKRLAPKLLKEDSKIKVKVLRGIGTVSADCSKKLISIAKGDSITIKKHPKKAIILHLHGYDKKAICTGRK